MKMSVNSTTTISHIEEEEALDPRVQVELENLNAATNEINSLESALEEANNCFRTSLNETSVQLQSLSKKLGVCVEKARPYYEVKDKAKKLQLDCQRAAVQYQRANAVHQAARETIALAEDRFANLRESSKERKFDSAWQEMLNHATMKVMEAEAQKSANEREHRKRAAAYTEAEKEVQELQNKLKTAINKSRPYFSHRAATQVKLEAQKDKIYKLQKDILMAKNKYSFTLRNLEQISEEIHEFRRINMKREPGVGAEMNSSEQFVEQFVEHPQNDECLFNSKVDEDQEYWSTLKRKIRDMKDNGEEIQKNNNSDKDSVLVFKDNLSLSYHEHKNQFEKSSILESTKTREIETSKAICNKEYTKDIDDVDDNDNRKCNDTKSHLECEQLEYNGNKTEFDKRKQHCDTISLSDITLLDKESNASDLIRSDQIDQTRFNTNDETRSEPSGQAMFKPNGLVEMGILLGAPLEEGDWFPKLKDLPSESNFVSSAVKKFETFAMTCTKIDSKAVLNENENVTL